MALSSSPANPSPTMTNAGLRNLRGTRNSQKGPTGGSIPWTEGRGGDPRRSQLGEGIPSRFFGAGTQGREHLSTWDFHCPVPPS